MTRNLLLGLLLLLTGCEPDGGRTVARRLLPGQALATYVPASGPSPQLLQSLTLHLSEPAEQGSLRLRLVNAEQSGSRLELRPGKTDLLAHPLALTPAQLRAAKGTLTLPLAGTHVQLPANGLFLVVECCPCPDIQTAQQSPDNYPSLRCSAGAHTASITYLKPDSAADWQGNNLPDTVSVEMALAGK